MKLALLGSILITPFSKSSDLGEWQLFEILELERDIALNGWGPSLAQTTSLAHRDDGLEIEEDGGLRGANASPPEGSTSGDGDSPRSSSPDSTIEPLDHEMQINGGPEATLSSSSLFAGWGKSQVFTPDEQISLLGVLAAIPQMTLDQFIIEGRRAMKRQQFDAQKLQNYRKTMLRFTSVRRWFHDFLWESRFRTISAIVDGLRARWSFCPANPGCSVQQVRYWLKFCIQPLMAGDLGACEQRNSMITLSLEQKRRYFEYRMEVVDSSSRV